MASTFTNRGAKELADGGISGRTFKIILLETNTVSWKTAATARDFNFVSQISADEVADASYGRQTVVLTITEVDASDWATIAHAIATFSALATAAAPSGVEGYAVIRFVTDDSDSTVWATIDLSVDIPTAADRTPNDNDFIINAATFARVKTA
jgi:hypothetical protein